MTPVIALVGRPNVGKSTLFNQMTRSRDALVADFPGLTRDRKYGEGSYEGQRFIVIDTGGLTGDEQGLDLEMARQSMQAVEEADIVLFLVDGRAGLTAGDELIADSLRRSGKQAHLVVNKTDGQDPDIAASDFYSLGFESTFLIAASHNRGIRSMLEILLPSEEEREEEDRADRYPGIRIGVVGRPNVGKSTLVNRLLYPDTTDTGDFITLFYLEFDMARRQLRWVRAGHDPALRYDPRNDRFTELTGEGMALGIEEAYDFMAHSSPMGDPGQVVVIGTDGIWEAHNPQREMFGKERLREVIRTHHHLSAQAIRDAVFRAVADFTGQDQDDDITLAVIKLL